MGRIEGKVDERVRRIRSRGRRSSSGPWGPMPRWEVRNLKLKKRGNIRDRDQRSEIGSRRSEKGQMSEQMDE